MNGIPKIKVLLVIIMFHLTILSHETLNDFVIHKVDSLNLRLFIVINNSVIINDCSIIKNIVEKVYLDSQYKKYENLSFFTSSVYADYKDEIINNKRTFAKYKDHYVAEYSIKDKVIILFPMLIVKSKECKHEK